MLKNGGDNQIHQFKTTENKKGSIEPLGLVAKTGIEPVTFGL